MTPITIDGQTDNVLKPPVNWDEQKDGVCMDLPFQEITTSTGQAAMASYWLPDAEERVNIADGAAIQLTVFGHVHPVVSLGDVQVLMHGDLRPPPTGDGPEQLRAQRDILLETITSFLRYLEAPGTAPSLDHVKQMRHIVSVCSQGGVTVDSTDLALARRCRELGIGTVPALEEAVDVPTS